MTTNIAVGKPASKESSITVAVRVRPFTVSESARLIVQKHDSQFYGDGAFSSRDPKPSNGGLAYHQGGSRYGPKGIRKVVNVVDERMLIFDPAEENPIQKMQQSLFPNSTSRVREHKFTFDRLFDEDASQEDVYEDTTKPLLDSVLEGYNATVFAYGATGCGKTHTITGTPEKPGIIFSTTKELFKKIDALKDTKAIEVSVSYLEIYNETIRDLLNPETESKLLTIREDANHKISVRNLSSHRLTTVEEVMDLIMKGNSNRTVNSTEANATSSRSHAVLQISIDQKDRTAGLKEEHYFATLSIIDLAGSERASATKNIGKRLHEGANINRSLLALGNCINALCDPRKRNHVPYRDSKLTRLLKFSLGGNCKTVMIVCISPSSQHYDETLNTLKYANRAKEIKTKVIRNTHNLDRHVGSYLKMITEQKQEIEELRSREKTAVQQSLNAMKLKKEKCALNLIQALDKLKLAIQKHEIEVFKKSRLIVKKRILCLQRLEINLLLKSFYENYGSKFVDVPRDLVDIKDTFKKVIKKLDQEIKHIDTLYERENEIQLILDRSFNLTLKKLKDLEGWTDYDTLIFESMVENLKKDVNEKILSYSNNLWDSVISKKGENVSTSFNFLSNSFFKVFKKLTFINTSGDVEIIRDENLSLINGMLNDCYEVLNGNLGFENLDKFLKFEDLEKASGEKRMPSPVKINLSPHKTFRNNKSTKVRSPKNKTTFKSKTVRWDLLANKHISPVKANMEDEVNEEDHDNNENDENFSDEDLQEESGVNLDSKIGGTVPENIGEPAISSSPMVDAKFTFNRSQLNSNFLNYQSPSRLKESLDYNRLGLHKKNVGDGLGEAHSNASVTKVSNNSGPKSSLTGMSLKPNTESDLSRLSLDTSMLLDKENISMDQKHLAEDMSNTSIDLQSGKQHNPQEQSFLGMYGLYNNDKKFNIGPPVRLAQPPTLQSEDFQFEPHNQSLDRFNFEANLSGDIQMSDVENE